MSPGKQKYEFILIYCSFIVNKGINIYKYGNALKSKTNYLHSKLMYVSKKKLFKETIFVEPLLTNVVLMPFNLTLVMAFAKSTGLIGVKR